MKYNAWSGNYEPETLGEALLLLVLLIVIIVGGFYADMKSKDINQRTAEQIEVLDIETVVLKEPYIIKYGSEVKKEYQLPIGSRIKKWEKQYLLIVDFPQENIPDEVKHRYGVQLENDGLGLLFRDLDL